MRVMLFILALVVFASPASAQTIKPLTPQEIDGYRGPNYSVADIENRIRRQIYDAEPLAEEILKEFDKEVATTGLGAVAKAVKVFGALGEATETGTHCKSGAGVTSIAAKSNELGIAHDNVIAYEQILQEKFKKQYGNTKGNQLFFAFRREAPMAQFQGLNIKKISQTKCSSTPNKPAPTTQACNCHPPTKYAPTREGALQEQAAVNAYAQCMVKCKQNNKACGNGVRC